MLRVLRYPWLTRAPKLKTRFGFLVDLLEVQAGMHKWATDPDAVVRVVHTCRSSEPGNWDGGTPPSTRTGEGVTSGRRGRTLGP